VNDAASRLALWRADPVTFVRDNFKTEPDQWQVDVLRAAGGGEFNPRRMLAMKACTGPGKSAVLAWLGWHRLTCFALPKEHPKGAALSITADNLKDNLWAELAKWQSYSPLLMGAFKWTKERIYAVDHPETWFLSARSFAKDADDKAIGRALSGLHGQFPFVLLDETGDMPLAVGRAAQQIFTGNPLDAMVAQAGNPTSTTGLLYETCNVARSRWVVVTITADPDDPKRTPRVSVQHAQDMIDTYGRSDPWVMATILGLFPPAGFNQLLSLEEVNEAMARHYPESAYASSAMVLGVDVAREGDDKSAIFPRQGVAAFAPEILRNADSLRGAASVIRMWNARRADACFVDGTGGFGAGWVDQLQAMNYQATAIHFGSKASDAQRFANRRAEMWWKMAQWVKAGGALPNVPELVAELTTPTYSFRGDAILLEPKERVKARLGRSPDLADALALTFAMPVQSAAQQQRAALEDMVAESMYRSAVSHDDGRRYDTSGRGGSRNLGRRR
jgi:phage terminase large subunit